MNRDSPGSAGFFRCLARNGGGPVFAMIIYDDNRELTGIILFAESPDSLRNGFGFIARGNDSNNPRPACQRFGLSVVFAHPPEIATRSEERRVGKGSR